MGQLEFSPLKNRAETLKNRLKLEKLGYRQQVMHHGSNIRVYGITFSNAYRKYTHTHSCIFAMTAISKHHL